MLKLTNKLKQLPKIKEQNKAKIGLTEKEKEELEIKQNIKKKKTKGKKVEKTEKAQLKPISEDAIEQKKVDIDQSKVFIFNKYQLELINSSTLSEKLIDRLNMNILRHELLTEIMYYMQMYCVANIEKHFKKQTPAQKFGEIYYLFKIEEALSSDKLQQIINMNEFSTETAKKINNILRNENFTNYTVYVNMNEIINNYNKLLLQLPELYRDIKTEILKKIEEYNSYPLSNVLLTLPISSDIKNDKYINYNPLNAIDPVLISSYNDLNLSLFNDQFTADKVKEYKAVEDIISELEAEEKKQLLKEGEIEEEAPKVPTDEKEDLQIVKQKRKLSNKIKKLKIKFIKDLNTTYEELEFMKSRRKEVKKLLYQTNPDVTEKDVDNYINYNINLPYINFLLEYLNTGKIQLNKHDNVDIVFKEYFNNIDETGKIVFMNYILKDINDFETLQQKLYDISVTTELRKFILSNPNYLLNIEKDPVYYSENYNELFDKFINFSELELFHYRPFIFKNFNNFNDEQKDTIINKYNDLILLPYRIENINGQLFIYSGNEQLGGISDVFFELTIGTNDIEELRETIKKNYSLLFSIQTKNQFINALENYFNSSIYFYFTDDLVNLFEELKTFINTQLKNNINIDEKLAEKISDDIKLKNLNKKKNLNFEQLKNLAYNYGINIYENLKSSVAIAIEKLEKQLQEKEITEDQFLSEKTIIENIQYEFEQLKDIEYNEELKAIKINFDKFINQKAIELGYIKQGKQLPSELKLQLETLYLDEAIQNYIISMNDYENLKKPKSVFSTKELVSKAYKNINNLILTMPEALNKAFQENLEAITTQFINPEDQNVMELNQYYQFTNFVNTIILDAKQPNIDLVKKFNEISFKYPNLNIQFKANILALLTKPDVTKNDITDFTTKFLSKNPTVKEEYYKFISKIEIEHMKNKDPNAIVDVFRLEFPLITDDFKLKVLALLKQKDITGNKLYKFVTEFLTTNTLLLKDPLQNNGKERRIQRYNKLIKETIDETPFVTTIKKIPSYLPPHLKQIIIPHFTKPWIDIKEIDKWTNLIALPTSKKYNEMSDQEKSYFDITYPKIKTIAVKYGDRTYYFYKPSNKFWIEHVVKNHQNYKIQKCDSNLLTKNYIISDIKKDQNNDDKFYELLYKDPLEYVDYKENENSIDINIFYTDDIPNKLIFLSKNPKFYELECDWFNKKPLIKINSYKTEKVTQELRNYVITILIDKLRKLKEKYKIFNTIDNIYFNNNYYNEVFNEAKELENLIYQQTINETSDTVYNYLYNLVSFITFFDPSNPIGNKLIFYPSLLAFSSREYYKVIFKNYKLPGDKILELTTIPQNLTNFLESSYNTQIDEIIINFLKFSFDKNEFNEALSIINNVKLNTILPANLGFRNLCKNIDDFKGLNENELIYYKNNNEVFCISKLELSKMANMKIYKFKDIVFDRKFVEDFSDYTKYFADELALQNKLMEQVLKEFSNLEDNLSVLDELKSIAVERDITKEDLQDPKINLFIKIGLYNLSNEYIVNNIVNKVNSLIKKKINSQIKQIVQTYISDNEEKLNNIIKSQIELFNSPQNALKNTLLKNSNEVITFINKPILELIKNYLYDNTEFKKLNVMDIGVINFLINNLTSKKEDIPKPYICKKCKTSIEEPKYTSVEQIRDGLMTNQNIIYFCSKTCFDKYNIEDPLKEDIDLARLQIAIDKITENWMTLNEMIDWAKFPSYWNIPSGFEAQKNFILEINKKLNIPIPSIITQFNSIKGNRSALAIPVVKFENNVLKQITQSELWDRIRTNINFQIPVRIILNNPEKYKYLEYICKKFNLRISNYDFGKVFYRKNPQLLQEIWNTLMDMQSFKQTFYSIIKTFNTNDMLIPEGITIPFHEFTSDQSLLRNIEEQIHNEISEYPGLQYLLVEENDENFIKLRTDLINLIINKYPSYKITIKPSERKALITFKNTANNLIKYFIKLYNNVANTPEPDYRNFKIPVYNSPVLSEKDFFTQLKKCDTFTNNSSSEIQKKIIRFIKTIISKTKSEYPVHKYYEMFINEFKCTHYKTIESKYIEIAINIERLNLMIDKCMGEEIDKRLRLQEQGIPTLENIRQIFIELNTNQILTEKQQLRYIDDLNKNLGTNMSRFIFDTQALVSVENMIMNILQDNKISRMSKVQKQNYLNKAIEVFNATDSKFEYDEQTNNFIPITDTIKNYIVVNVLPGKKPTIEEIIKTLENIPENSYLKGKVLKGMSIREQQQLENSIFGILQNKLKPIQTIFMEDDPRPLYIILQEYRKLVKERLKKKEKLTVVDKKQKKLKNILEDDQFNDDKEQLNQIDDDISEIIIEDGKIKEKEKLDETKYNYISRTPEEEKEEIEVIYEPSADDELKEDIEFDYDIGQDIEDEDEFVI